jgi:hypothetical protein
MQEEKDEEDEEISAPYDGIWEAILDTMPPTPHSLRVKGVLQMPTPAYTLTLKEHEPQGTNPDILLLDLIVTPPDPDIIVPQVITEETFERETENMYSSVTILPDGPYIKVEIVS